MDRKTKFRIWRNRGAFALLAGIAGVGTIANHLRSELSEQDAPAWAPGTAATYRLEWQMDSEVAMDGQPVPLTGHVDLTASLSLVGHGEVDGATLIEASFAGVGRHRLEVLGREAFPDDDAASAQLVGPSAWVKLVGGKVEQVYFDRSAPPAFKHVMQSVVGLAQITQSPNDGAEWTATEAGPSGIAEVTYRRNGDSLVRTRDHYSKLTVVPNVDTAKPQGSASIELEGGRIATLVDDETLSIPHRYEGHSHFSIALEQTHLIAVRPVPALADLEARRLAEPTIDGDTDRAHLEQRAGNLTFDGVVHGLRTPWSDRGAKREWFGQAVALLRLDTALCAEVVEIAFAGTDDRIQLLAMELLASTGHAQAQAAMRDALGRVASAGGAAKPQQVALIQKFIGVVHPTAESARFLLTAAGRTSDRNLSIATAYTMGAVANRIRETDPALAAALGASIRDSLTRATTSADRAQLLTAIGNSASPDDFQVVRTYTTDADPDVRGRAAWALRGISTPAARDTLLDLVGDADPNVARSSLGALATQPLTAADFERLELATAGDLADASRAALIDLLGTHLSDASPAVRRMLEAITARSTDSNLQERARVVLAQLH